MSAPKPDPQARSVHEAAVSLHGTSLDIPDYELIRRIGNGSYGEVWLVKNVLGGYRAAKFVERKGFSKPGPFEREFGGIKKFEPVSRTHPGFVSILHAGRNEVREYFYYIMEIADDITSGQTIIPEKYVPRTLSSDLSSRTKLSLDDCLDTGISLAAALKHLHLQGLIHRDIKPSNIIFINGAAKLADIGLVTAITDEGTSLGTRGYVPSDEPAGPASDLYSLGMVLYEASTGKSPAQFPDLPTQLGPIGDSDRFSRFNDIVLKACETAAQERFHSAAAMHAALSGCKDQSNALENSHDAAVQKQQTPSPRQAERKLVTALAVNIAASGRIDPEVLQSFMDACIHRIRPAVQRYEGILIHSLNDGAMATFGGAVAVEDHSRRATLAALEIAETLKAARPELLATYEFDFAVRIGLNTGLALAARTKDSLPPTGDAVNLASRVLGLAEPGQVLITDDLWKVVRDHFVTRPLGEKPSQSPSSTIKLHEVLAARALRTRIEVEAERGLTPFVGRRSELALLNDRLDLAQAGHGQVVLLAGEAGMGKSRLLLEFQSSLAGREICWLAGRSISFGGQMAYLPIIDLLKHWFQIKGADDLATMSACVEAETRALDSRLEAAAPFLKYLLSLHSSGDPISRMDAQERRVKTFESLRNLFLIKAATAPLVVVIEDLHWADKTSEEFLLTLADCVSMARLLLIVTYRPAHTNPFPERSFISRAMLQPLSRDESLALATRVLLSQGALCDDLKNLVIAKAEGNPFFLEEMIKSLQESGAFRVEEDRSVSASTVLHVPDTIQDVIMSRIDRLDESPRTTLQLASVIGREFSVPLLETIADLNEPLADSLRKLKNLELIYERALFPEHTCFFKHALTQEVAYNSLLLQRRKELHCLVAAALEEMHAARLPEFYELLAFHYERGEEWERALDYLRRAAEQCRSVGAYREEVHQLSRAMAIAKRLGHTELTTELRGRRGAARVKLGMISEAKPDLEAALADLPSENRARRAELLLSMAGACFWGLDTPGTQRYGAEGHAMAQEAGRKDLVAEALNYLGASQQSLGNLAAASSLFEEARAQGGGCFSPALANYPLTLYLSGRLRESAEVARQAADVFLGANDAFAASFGHPHLGLALAASGRYAEAAAVFQEAKQLGVKHEIWHFRARAIGMSAGFHLDVFDFEGNESLAQDAREQARSAPFRPTEVSATIDLTLNFIRRGCISQAEHLVKEAESMIGLVAGWHEWLWRLRMKQARAELAVARREWESSLALASDAICESRARGRLKYVAGGLETRARALAAIGRRNEAVTDLRSAAELARTMGDPALLIRVVIPLIQIEGDDALLSEARATARQILAALPNDEMRRRFNAAQPVQSLGQI